MEGDLGVTGSRWQPQRLVWILVTILRPISTEQRAQCRDSVVRRRRPTALPPTDSASNLLECQKQSRSLPTFHNEHWPAHRWPEGGGGCSATPARAPAACGAL